MDLNSFFSENEAEAIRLIEEGADANVLDIFGYSPMYFATEYGNNIHLNVDSHLSLITKIFFKASKK